MVVMIITNGNGRVERMDAKKPELCGSCHRRHKAKIETLQAENERLRNIEEKARAVIEARKTMKHIERSSSFFELIAALNELQDALKGGS